MHQRYSDGISTIQIRHVPEEVHRTYRRRAAAAGMSLQEYLLAELVRGAQRHTPEELVAEFEAQLEREGEGGLAARSAAAAIREDRDTR